MRTRVVVAASLALLAVCPAHAARARRPSPSSATARYRSLLDDVRSRKKPSLNLEALYDAAVAAGREIEAGLTRADEATARGQTAAPGTTSLEGLAISGGEAIYAVPVPEFFRTLAEQRGRPADRAFFDLLAATRPGGVWPVYVAQQTDASGCTLFDLPELPSLYSRWLSFQARFPRAYRAHVARELGAIDEQLLGTCACGDHASVVTGLEAFVWAQPKAPISARLQARLRDIRAGAGGVRFKCRSG